MRILQICDIKRNISQLDIYFGKLNVIFHQSSTFLVCLFLHQGFARDVVNKGFTPKQGIYMFI